ncbi:hypothetical protein Q1695_006584 [Nippostrongylus brasiliensis]|nr:hypothetical protein Q1695_006584 [Nippostrongylus brasiliensis]
MSVITPPDRHKQPILYPSPPRAGDALLRRQKNPLLTRGHLIWELNYVDVVGFELAQAPTHHDTGIAYSSSPTIASEQDVRTLLHRSRNIKYDIIALQETKGKTETIKKADHKEFLIIGVKLNRRNIGGVGFIVNSTVHHLADSYKIVGSQVAVLRLEVKDQAKISIINGYAPTSAAADEEKEEFYELLERTVNDEKSYYKVVDGDFNATVGINDCDEWRLGPHGSSSRNDNGMRLVEFLSACRLFHGNSMFEKPSHRRWTWESPNGEVRSEIEHVLLAGDGVCSTSPCFLRLTPLRITAFSVPS